MFAKFYNKNPKGVINDRFTKKWFDFSTPEYSQFTSIQSKKWESCRGTGYSFGYNKMETEDHTIKTNELIKLLITIVSRNGNLLLNVGPKANGEIPEVQLKPLLGLGEWLSLHKESIFSTRPWKIDHLMNDEKLELYFTQKGKENLELFVFIFIPKETKIKTFTIPKDVLLDKKFFLRYKIMRLDTKNSFPPMEETSNFYKFKIPNDIKNEVLTLRFMK
jgi:alpha-L-fucosidase